MKTAILAILPLILTAAGPALAAAPTQLAYGQQPLLVLPDERDLRKVKPAPPRKAVGDRPTVDWSPTSEELADMGITAAAPAAPAGEAPLSALDQVKQPEAKPVAKVEAKPVEAAKPAPPPAAAEPAPPPDAPKLETPKLPVVPDVTIMGPGGAL